MIIVMTNSATVRGRLFGPGAQLALPIPEAVQLIAEGVAQDAFPADVPEVDQAAVTDDTTAADGSPAADETPAAADPQEPAPAGD